jgi:hypothetical protein
LLAFYQSFAICCLLLTPCLLLVSLGLHQARASFPLVIGLAGMAAMIGSAFADPLPFDDMTPPTLFANDTIYNLGAVFYTSEPICITGVRFYAPSAGSYPTHIWNDNDTGASFLAASVASPIERGWTSSEFANGVIMTGNDKFVASYINQPDSTSQPGSYAYQYYYFNVDRKQDPLTFPGDTTCQDPNECSCTTDCKNGRFSEGVGIQRPFKSLRAATTLWLPLGSA